MRGLIVAKVFFLQIKNLFEFSDFMVDLAYSIGFGEEYEVWKMDAREKSTAAKVD